MPRVGVLYHRLGAPRYLRQLVSLGDASPRRAADEASRGDVHEMLPCMSTCAGRAATVVRCRRPAALFYETRRDFSVFVAGARLPPRRRDADMLSG